MNALFVIPMDQFNPTEQHLNLAAYICLCYVSWLRICLQNLQVIFLKSEKAVPDLNWIGGNISSNKRHNFEHFGHFRFPIPVANWKFLIKVEPVF